MIFDAGHFEFVILYFHLKYYYPYWVGNTGGSGVGSLSDTFYSNSAMKVTQNLKSHHHVQCCNGKKHSRMNSEFAVSVLGRSVGEDRRAANTQGPTSKQVHRLKNFQHPRTIIL